MTTSAVLSALEALLPGLVLTPGRDGYAEATSPQNASFPQTPGAVVWARTAGDVSLAVQVAAQYGHPVLVHASGHGAAQAITDDTVLIDTSALNDVTIDAVSRTATVGAGATWAKVQTAATGYGLLGLGGTSPSVAVAGYAFGGGVGWFVRKHGLAAAALRSVEYVSSTGCLRVASADASEAVDREALWAFRGGAPVGLATSIVMDLVPVAQLWTGSLLWPVDALADVAAAWSAAVADIDDDVTSDLSLLQLPADGPFPEHLRGSAAVHLSYASPDGPANVEKLRASVVGAASPAVDTTGPGDVASLTTIHLDPPVAVPARGVGRWLHTPDAEAIVAMFTAAAIGSPDGLNMIELRHTASAAQAPDGMQTRVSGPFLLHAVGAAPDEAARQRVDAVLSRVRAAARPVDTGRSAPSFCEGILGAVEAFPASDIDRLRAARDALDSDRLFRFQRDPLTDK
ncbi:FAD-binding oxidoreductase [Mycobacterium sp. NPDC048908]|uniref:FAD-binding oxidoreductase n=1 Tax=Mycobacterium sp. NPDC048908 TaxID=3364292 RepID=UPI003711369E